MANKTRLDELKAYIQAQGWRWQSGKPIAHGEQIIVTAGPHQAMVNYYPKRGRLVPGGPDSPLKEALAALIKGDAVPRVSHADPSPPAPTGTRLDALKQFVREQGWNWGPGAEIPYGEQIVVSDAGMTALVNFWPKRGKMQVQGPDSPLKAVLQGWVTGEPVGTPEPAPTTITGPHIGMDESGKGDWFGPLVVAAVYVDERTADALHRRGVQDSKNLSEETILRLAGEIERLIPVQHRHVWAIEPETYNRRYEQHRNINLLLADAYAQVAHRVCEATQAKIIVCDQFAHSTERLESAFAQHDLPVPVQHHQAEALSIAVAAASILAGAAFTESLVRLGQEAGLGASLPKGASDTAALENSTQHILATQGREALGHYAKLHFKPLRALLGEEPQAVVKSTAEARTGPPVTIRQEVWRVQYHPSGFWRFTFSDGGILDWYEDTTGRLDVRGKPAARSCQILMEQAHGRIWKGDLESVKRSVNNHIPRFGEINVPSVLDVGWQRRATVLGARFDFTDGGVLNYYRGRDTLSIQGTPAPLTRAVLEALPSPFWAGLDELTDSLKQLFPDWRLGELRRSDEVEGTEMDTEPWSPGEDAVNWRAFWPADREMRQAANKVGPCQRAMVEDWASVLIYHGGKHHLLAQAPTGLGKTLAALVPALAWVAQAPDQRRIYYLVNRVAQHENPIRELKAGLAAAFETQTGQPLRVVDIVGRHQLCRYPQVRSLPDFCKQSRDTAYFDLLPNGVASWQEVKAHLGDRACPYHTLQGLMAQAHVVVCDYWWLFSQVAQESGLTERARFSPRDSILIVDEAHNLPLRVRAELDVDEPVARVLDAIHRAPLQVRTCLEPIVTAVQEVDPEEGASPSTLLPLAGGIGAVYAALDVLAADELAEAHATLPERMLRLLLQPDEAVVIYPMVDAEGERRLVFRLVDPIPVLQAGYGQVHASLSMSGTLAAPSDDSDELRYQVPLFGLPLRETLTRKYASPFPLRNQRWIYSTDTYGTYRERGNHLSRYAEHIVNVGQATPGVTAVFFSSYAFLESVQASITDRAEQALIVAETRADAEAVTDDARGLQGYETRLRTLEQEHGRAYLFAVYRGKLSEGADFVGNLVRSIVCVSIPLEYPGLYHKRLQELYQEAFAPIVEERGDDLSENAREYALDRHSLSLVLQACGRGIRHKRDRCAFVLLDRRYHDYGWRRFLEPRPYNLLQPERTVEDFHRMSAVAVSRGWDEAILRVGAGSK